MQCLVCVCLWILVGFAYGAFYGAGYWWAWGGDSGASKKVLELWDQENLQPQKTFPQYFMSFNRTALQERAKKSALKDLEKGLPSAERPGAHKKGH